MTLSSAHQQDIDTILSHRYDLDWDYWTSSDKRLIKGSPFSAYNSIMMLLSLGMEPATPLLHTVAELFFDALRDDGRFSLYPSGAIYPCQTALGLNLLCAMGYGADPRLEKTFSHLLQIQHTDGGLRCNKFSFGRGPETEFSNPHPTLVALDALRQSPYANHPAADKAVAFLLNHWVIKKPIGPCHYGIGSLFMQVEFPMGGYNLFYYVYVLSFYQKARKDERFLQALAALTAKTENGQIIVERVVPKLRALSFCQKDKVSELATEYYQKILQNMK